MSFAPNQSLGLGMPAVVRNLLFWALMIMLAFVMWQMASRSHSDGSTQDLSYSDFMKQVDAGNVQLARFSLSQNMADVTGDLKQPAQRYRTTVPRDTASGLMNTLRGAGVEVQVAEGKTWQEEFVTIAPVILFIGFWIFMLRQKMRAQRDANTPHQPSPGALG